MTSRRLSVGVVAGFEQADAIGHVDDWLVDRGGHLPDFDCTVTEAPSL
jgi:hypothetical protein